MNNFLKNLTFYQTNQRAYVQEPFSFEDTFTSIRYVPDYVEYDLSARIGERVAIRDNTDTEAKNLIKHQLMRSLNEHVHGGYRLPLLDLFRHLVKRGDQEGIKQVEKIIDGMFKV